MWRVGRRFKPMVHHVAHPGEFLIANGKEGCVVLSLLQPFVVDPPKLLRPDPRREPALQALAIDQPVRLRIAPDNRRRQQRQAQKRHRCDPIS